MECVPVRSRWFLVFNAVLGAAFAFLGLGTAPATSWAGDVAVIGAEATFQGNGNFRFDVTLRHGDTGWDHYADRFEVLSPDGKVLGTRVLAHPHVNEQPFTRSLGNVVIEKGVSKVRIRAHDSVHGTSADVRTVLLPPRH